MELGTLAEWAGAIAAVIGTLISLFALSYARKANETAEATRRESQAANKEAHDLEAQRDKRLLAGSLQAWWAKKHDENTWGVLVANLGQAGTVFRDVTITAKVNEYRKVLDLQVVPPGLLFVESTAAGSGWGLPAAVEPHECDYLAKSSKHEITRIDFTDQLGVHWSWDPDRGPTEVGLPE